MRRLGTREMPQFPRIKVLIAHSDPLISAGLAVTLRMHRDFETFICAPVAAKSHATESPMPSADVAVTDYESGLRLIASAGAASPRAIILTHSDREANICRALKQGARGYLLLGCSLHDLIHAVRSVYLGGTALAPLVAHRIAERRSHQILTRREEEILRQMMLGLSNKGIAANLTLAVGTVKTHVKSVLEKLDAASRTDAVAVAQRRGILPEERDCMPPAMTAIGTSTHSDDGGPRRHSQWSRGNSVKSGGPISGASRESKRARYSSYSGQSHTARSGT